MHDFPQRNHDEISFLHQGMRNLEIGHVDVEVVVEKNINIDDAVVILAIHRLEGIDSCKVSPIHTEDYPVPAQRPHYSVLDKSKIKETFGLEQLARR